MSTENGPGRLETQSTTQENNGKDQLENIQDTASETGNKSLDKLADKEKERKDDSSSSSITELVDDTSNVPDDEEISKSPIPGDMEAPTGPAPCVSELADENESSNPLIESQKHAPSKSLWKSVRNSFNDTKSTDALPPVHTEAWLSSADFSVAVVTYKRTTSRDYSKVDIHYHDDDEDQSALYSDISTSWATSFWTQFTVLLQRSFKQSKPDILSKLDVIQNSLLAVIAGLIWFQLPYKEESIVDRYSLIFFVIMHLTFFPLFQALMSFPNEATVVNKERAAGYYRLSAYYLAKLCSELPLIICQPAMFFTIAYWMTGLNRSEAFLSQLLLLLLTAVVGQSVGLCIGATVMDFKKSIVVAIVYGVGGMLLGGFFQQHVPSWLAWLQYGTYMLYSYDAALSIEFSSTPTFSCRQMDSSYAACRNNGTTIEGSDILEKLNVSRTVGENISVLLLFVAIFRILTYLSLRYLHKPK